MARLLKDAGKKIVFDNDDTYKDMGGFKLSDELDHERMKRGLKRVNDGIDSFIIDADLVTCSTEFLATEYRKLNPNVVVLPNCVDPFYFDEPLRNETDVVRIGITGSIAVTTDIKILAPIMKHYENDKRVRLVLFSLPPNRQDKTLRKLYAEEYKVFDSMNFEWQAFVPIDQYFDKLNELRLDIMIIPRSDNYFNRCKSNVKFLEASGFEIPVIASGFPDKQSPYEQNPEDAKHMVIVPCEGYEASKKKGEPWKADSQTDLWIREIEKLIKDKALRREMGAKAKKYVFDNYNINRKYYLWANAYESIK
jgi:glycosyltransferase involved in cell wall biosynthesis